MDDDDFEFYAKDIVDHILRSVQPITVEGVISSVIKDFVKNHPGGAITDIHVLTTEDTHEVKIKAVLPTYADNILVTFVQPDIDVR